MAQPFTYSDINPDLGQSPLGELVYDVDAINASIENILGTRVGERFFFPEFGSHLWSVLFDPMLPRTEMVIKAEILAAISRWEPRVTILAALVSSDTLLQRYDVSITWKYKNFDQVNNVSVNLKRL
jgi:phage baseplate assembly protein W